MRKILLLFLTVIFLFSATAFATSSTEENSAEYWFKKAQEYSKQKDYDNTILAYTKVIEIEPSNGPAYYNRGNAYAISRKT